MTVGLSVALAFVILMGCFVWQQGSVGRQYPDFKRIYCAGYCNSTFSSVRFSNIISGQILEIEQTVNIVLYEGPAPTLPMRLRRSDCYDF